MGYNQLSTDATFSKWSMKKIKIWGVWKEELVIISSHNTSERRYFASRDIWQSLNRKRLCTWSNRWALYRSSSTFNQPALQLTLLHFIQYYCQHSKLQVCGLLTFFLFLKHPARSKVKILSSWRNTARKMKKIANTWIHSLSMYSSYCCAGLSYSSGWLF